MDYGEGAVAGLGEAGHSDVFRELVFDDFAKVAAITRKKKAERAAKNDAIGLEARGERGEAESNALGDFAPDGLVLDI